MILDFHDFDISIATIRDCDYTADFTAEYLAVNFVAKSQFQLFAIKISKLCKSMYFAEYKNYLINLEMGFNKNIFTIVTTINIVPTI
jgi:hypothetical protein